MQGKRPAPDVKASGVFFLDNGFNWRVMRLFENTACNQHASEQQLDHPSQTPPGQGGQWQSKPERQPALNIPPVITVLSILFVLIQAARSYLLTPQQDFEFILQFSFIPAYFTLPLDQVPYPAARYWSYFTYAFLHGGWTHVFVNLLWMVAFGSVVAKRFGAVRFLMFSLLAAIAGAAAHFITNMNDVSPVIGASASVSAYLGAASRFILGPGGLAAGQMRGGSYQPPAMSLAQALTNRNVLLFVGVWFALNILFGTGLVPIAGTDAKIAWEAHVGGFLFGILAFSLFDPVARNRP